MHPAPRAPLAAAVVCAVYLRAQACGAFDVEERPEVDAGPASAHKGDMVRPMLRLLVALAFVTSCNRGDGTTADPGPRTWGQECAPDRLDGPRCEEPLVCDASDYQDVGVCLEPCEVCPGDVCSAQGTCSDGQSCLAELGDGSDFVCNHPCARDEDCPDADVAWRCIGVCVYP